MVTKLLTPATDSTAFKQAAQLIREGEVVGIPTETVYGLGANALDANAVRKIFIAKGRPQDNPLIVHIADYEQLSSLCPNIPVQVPKLAARFWPGPLTMIVPKSPRIPYETSAGLDTIGIRLPAHPIAREIIRLAGLPVAAPSANLSGHPSTTTAQHVMDDLNGKIPAVVDGGPCLVGVESTVVSLTGEQPRLLRPGGITYEQLKEVIGEIVIDPALYEAIGDQVQVSAPGMKYRHYAPKAPVTVVLGTLEATAKYICAHADTHTGVLCFDECAPLFQNLILQTFGSSHDLPTQAQLVFDKLRAFDETDVTKIFAQCPDNHGLGLAVANRICKAAGFHIITV